MDSLMALAPALLLVAFWAWLVARQRRNAREVATLQASLAVGDEIVTVGGIIGRLRDVSGPVVGLEVAPGVTIRIDRRTVSARTSDVPGLTGVETPVHVSPSDNPGQD